MANTQYVTANRLSADASDSRKKVLMFGAPVVLVLCAVFPGLWWWFLAALLILFLNAGSIKRAGADGEDSTFKILSTLPDSYTIFNQIMLPNKESKSGHTELDFLVVGANGVFVVEVKNNNSRIVGSEEEREWTIHKIGRRGTPYTSSMRNPIKQIKGQIWVLNNFAKERGHKIWIEGVVFFSNPNSRLELRGNASIPIFQHSGLTNHIQSYRPKYEPQNLDKFVMDLALIKGTPVGV